jgi:hypothetical protein
VEPQTTGLKPNIVVAFGVPLIVLILGAALAWALSGFKNISNVSPRGGSSFVWLWRKLKGFYAWLDVQPWLVAFERWLRVD